MKHHRHSIPLFDREISWLHFNERILCEADDASVPWLERLKFLCIFASNLDEFFSVRLAKLTHQKMHNKERTIADYLTQTAQLKNRHDVTLLERVLPALAKYGLHIVPPPQWSARDQTYLGHWFGRHLGRDVRCPHFNKAFTPHHKLYLLWRKDARGALPQVLPLNTQWPRLIKLPQGQHRYALLEDIVKQHLLQSADSALIRLTPSYDLWAHAVMPRRVHESQETLRFMRIEATHTSDQTLVTQVAKQLELSHGQWMYTEAPLQTQDFLPLSALREGRLKALHDLPYKPRTPIKGHLFKAIRERERLLHHPYDSLTPITQLLTQAARDPQVTAISQTIYRTEANSKTMQALIKAAEAGKQVHVLVETRARFDEVANHAWVQQLKAVGVRIIRAPADFKVHAKLLLIERQEGHLTRRYAHIGTGNYHARTAQIYTDLSLLTARTEITGEVQQLFDSLRRRGPWKPSSQSSLHHLIAAPTRMRSWLLERIAEEARAGSRGRIFAQINALTDPDIIQALYKASRCGVKIDLLVRGMCCLVPGAPHTSENIRVYALLDRFLEHRRTFRFGRPGKEALYISSADWAERNLDRRIEIAVKIEAPELKAAMNAVIDQALKDNRKRWQLLTHGTYRRVPKGKVAHRSQEQLLKGR